MELHFQSVREAFPFIRQVISDAYKTDVFLYTWPYEDTERIDRGFRKMMWGETGRPALFTEFLANPSEHQMVIVKSSLGYYNIFASVSLEENYPDFITVGPFGDGGISDTFVRQLVRDQSLKEEQVDMVETFYKILPVADANDITLMLLHLLSAFIPEYHSVLPRYINYSEATHKITPNREAFQRFTTISAEYYAVYLNDFLDEMTLGDSKKASDKLKIFLDATGFTKITSLHMLKKQLQELNSICKSRMLSTLVHPYYSLHLSNDFSVQIDRCSRYDDLISLPYKMARRYSMLVKNYSHGEYSRQIRDIMAYIDEHMEEELSLSVLAKQFYRNPSSLSGEFTKETGETLTEYIHKARIQAAVRYFNTTNLSVTEVASNVGISNFGYFSRLFRKQIGMSPREYRKMMKSVTVRNCC